MISVPAFQVSALVAREWCAATAQAQRDALRLGWSHVVVAGHRFSAHVVVASGIDWMESYCEDTKGHLLWSKTEPICALPGGMAR